MTGPLRLPARLPMDPLRVAARCANWTQLAAKIGMTSSHTRHQMTRGLTWWQADDFALRCNLWAADVWPEWEAIANGESAAKYCPLLAPMIVNRILARKLPSQRRHAA